MLQESAHDKNSCIKSPIPSSSAPSMSGSWVVKHQRKGTIVYSEHTNGYNGDQSTTNFVVELSNEPLLPPEAPATNGENCRSFQSGFNHTNIGES